MNPMLRTDAAIARAVVAMFGGTMQAMMPWPKEDEVEGTPDNIMAFLNAHVRRKD